MPGNSISNLFLIYVFCFALFQWISTFNNCTEVIPTSLPMQNLMHFPLSKGKVVNIFGFVGHIACHKYSVPPLQHESSYRQCIHERVWLCSKKLHL